MRTESAEPEKRQKLCSGVKEKSQKGGIAAESLHESKGKVGYARKSGRKFTALSRNGRVRAKKRQKVYVGASRRCEQNVQTECADRMCGQEAKSTKLL